MLRRVALIRAEVSEEHVASIIRAIKIDELRTASAINSNRSKANVLISPILDTLMMEALGSSETSVLQEPHGLTSQKTAFFIVTAVETTNLTGAYVVPIRRKNLVRLVDEEATRWQYCG
jgi:hypothetical protein